MSGLGWKFYMFFTVFHELIISQRFSIKIIDFCEINSEKLCEIVNSGKPSKLENCTLPP